VVCLAVDELEELVLVHILLFALVEVGALVLLDLECFDVILVVVVLLEEQVEVD